MTGIDPQSLATIVGQMAELKAENDRLKAENESLRGHMKSEHLSAHVVRFFLDCLANGTKDRSRLAWVFTVSDVEFVACPDWRVRETIAALLAKATEKDNAAMESWIAKREQAKNA